MAVNNGTINTGWEMFKELVHITKRQSMEANRLSFEKPVEFVYNPLEYAWDVHSSYLKKYGDGEGRILLIGMNPGPWGMAQTGIPFGEISGVRDFLDLTGMVGKPKQEHPKRPILGFDCPRSEVSGRRVWEWARERYRTPEKFFKKYFLLNYCPLCFMEESGKNRTPDKLPIEEREKVYEVCDKALQSFVDVLKPSKIIGIGGFAKKRAMKSLNRSDVDTILHPSPASPIANRGWKPQIEVQLTKMGIKLP